MLGLRSNSMLAYKALVMLLQAMKLVRSRGGRRGNRSDLPQVPHTPAKWLALTPPTS